MNRKMRIFSIFGFVALTAIASVAVVQISSEQIKKSLTPTKQSNKVPTRFRQAVEQENVLAQYVLGSAYAKGEGVTRDPREAMRWLRKAAEQGLAKAQSTLGYAHGYGPVYRQFAPGSIDRDDREAVRWFRKAAEQGHAEAQYYLGLAYWRGKGVTNDLREAMRWFRKAAEQGNASAQVELAEAYYLGEGVITDPYEAYIWISILEASNSKWRAFSDPFLRDFYSCVLYGTSTHCKRRIDVLSKSEIHSAKKEVAQRLEVIENRRVGQRNATRKNDLGLAYANDGVFSQGQPEAVERLRKTAKQGDADAQFNLGTVYYLGEGVITNKYEAYIWFSIAKVMGGTPAADVLREFNLRDDLSESALRAAHKEASRRLKEIENRTEKPAEKPSADTNAAVALAPKGEEKEAAQRMGSTEKRAEKSNEDIRVTIASAPKGANTAAKVFENTWRSVVVVVNGDGQGSGVIIRPNIVATNCHVVNERGGIVVYKSNDRRVDTDTVFPATIRSSDEEQDFCLLEVARLQGVPAAVRRYDTLKVGEDVYGLGAPKGLDLSLSDGLISQLREVDGYRVIQTNVAISPGSSGGGLFDGEGNLVGILTEKIVDEDTEGIGFAIPADLVLEH